MWWLEIGFIGQLFTDGGILKIFDKKYLCICPPQLKMSLQYPVKWTCSPHQVFQIQDNDHWHRQITVSVTELKFDFTLHKDNENTKNNILVSFFRFFTARCHVSAVLTMALCLSVCLFVHPSVTSRCSTKTAKRRITQTAPQDSPGTLVFWCQRSPRNSTGVTPYGGTKCRWGGSKWATFDKYLENGKR